MRLRFCSVLFAAATLSAQDYTLPPLKRQPTPSKVVKEHMAAFSACDWHRIMQQFPENVELFFPNGMVVKGRKAVGEMYVKALQPPSRGGTCGLKISVEHSFVVGETINVQWKAEAPWLLEPYRGADAYETHDGLMAAQVSTFDGKALKINSATRP